MVRLAIYEQIKLIVIIRGTVQAINGSKETSTSKEMAQLNWKIPKQHIFLVNTRCALAKLNNKAL